jgi:hypothetical protein
MTELEVKKEMLDLVDRMISGKNWSRGEAVSLARAVPVLFKMVSDLRKENKRLLDVHGHSDGV